MSGSAIFDTAIGVTRTPMTRKHLARIFAERGFTKGAEVGTWQGAYAVELCKANPAMQLLCVDPWEDYPAWVDKKNEPGRHNLRNVYIEACAALHDYNVIIRREHSKDFAPTVKDGSLDFVYIDGNHVYDAVLEDLTLWAPKVRKGGIVSGHDYRQYSKQPEIQVERAVNDYVTTHEIDQVVVFDGDKKSPSFAWVVR